VIERIGRYQILRRLGAGGMAEVFLGRAEGEEGFLKQVAIKRILPEMGLDEGRVALFADEARMVAQLSHANIVQVFEFDHDGEAHYLVMEYVEGMTLAKALSLCRAQGTDMPLPAATAVAVQICDALEYAHTANAYDGTPMEIVHRDIKPTNVLITAQGQVKLADFGIARAAINLHETRTGKGKGTLAYMAPEQLEGGAVSPATDLYALGVVLFEMVAGKRLYDAAGIAGFVDRRRFGFRDEDADRVERRAAELLPVLRRCLAEESGGRFGSADELRSVLRGQSFFQGRDALRGWIRWLTTNTETLAELGGEPPRATSASPATTVVSDTPRDEVAGGMSTAEAQMRGAPDGDQGPAEPEPDASEAEATAEGRPARPSPPASPEPASAPRGRAWIAALSAGLAAVGLLIWHPWNRGPDLGDVAPVTPVRAGERVVETGSGTADGSTDGPIAADGRSAPAADLSPPRSDMEVRGDSPEEPVADVRPERGGGAGSLLPVGSSSPEPDLDMTPTASLTITTKPWAAVFVDGQQRADQGVLRNLELPLGTHPIRVVPSDGITPEGEFTVTFDEGGEVQKWRFEYRTEGWHAERR